MGLYHTNLEERVSDVDLTNSAINRITHCYNIASEEISIIKDNGIRDFYIIDSSSKTQIMKPFNNDLFL